MSRSSGCLQGPPSRGQGRPGREAPGLTSVQGAPGCPFPRGPRGEPGTTHPDSLLFLNHRSPRRLPGSPAQDGHTPRRWQLPSPEQCPRRGPAGRLHGGCFPRSPEGRCPRSVRSHRGRSWTGSPASAENLPRARAALPCGRGKPRGAAAERGSCRRGAGPAGSPAGFCRLPARTNTKDAPQDCSTSSPRVSRLRSAPVVAATRARFLQRPFAHPPTALLGEPQLTRPPLPSEPAPTPFAGDLGTVSPRQGQDP